VVATSEKINSLLLENHPWLLKLQWLLQVRSNVTEKFDGRMNFGL